MRILLFGNPSMMHSNLADGLRELGHEVTLVSHGYGWRQFPGTSIKLERNRKINGKLALIQYLWKVFRLLPKFRNYDIVQFSHCGFLEMRGNHLIPFYHYLRRHNKKIVMCCCDADYYFIDQVENHGALRYSEFQIGDKLRYNDNVNPLREQYAEEDIAKGIKKGWNTDLNKLVANDCDRIVPILYEYWTCYNNVFPQKTTFIPLPIVMPDTQTEQFSVGKKVKIMIGLQRDRMQIKGTDILLHAAQNIARDFPNDCEFRVVENVPYTEYVQIMNNSDVLIDQLYSYTPAMNALIAMSKGIVVVSGGEQENYNILGETELRPIINVEPTYESCYNSLKDLVLHKEHIPELKRQSVEYVRRHHDHIKVARQYQQLYNEMLFI